MKTMADVLLTIGLDSSAYSEFKKGIDGIIKQINSNPPKIKVEFDNKELDKMRKQIETLTKAQKDQANASKASANIEIGSTKQYNALRQVNNALTQVTLNTQKWTAAQKGQTHNQFDTYSKAASDLIDLATQLKQGTISAEDFDNKIAQIRSSMAETSGQIKVAGEATGEMTNSLSKAAANIVKFVGVYKIISSSIRIFKEMASVSMEIESAMAQIQVVTGATGAELEGFFQTSTSLAKELGQSITDVAKSIETFSRLGFKLEDASDLAKYATILSNVADTDIDAATTGMTSIIKGYDMDVSNAEHVADVLTKVGQAYAISAEELMTAFERGGASMYAEGTSFEKSAALFAATNASLQNAQKTGTIWNTVAARITASVSQLEEMGEETEGLADGFSKYREELLALTGVDVQKPTGEYRDLYDIFVDLAKVWDNLRSDQARSRVGEILGGTRNRAGIMSTITNIKDAINAYDDAMNSAGIAMQANDIIMETTEKHIEQLKVSFQELSANLISSDAIKGFVDLGTGFLQLLNNVQQLTSGFGGLPAVIGAVTVAISALRAGSVLGGIGNIFSSAIEGIVGMGAAGATLTGTLAAVAPAILAIGAAISTAASLFGWFGNLQENARQEALETARSFGETHDQLSSYAEQIRTLRDDIDSGKLSEMEAYQAKSQLLDIQNQLTEAYGTQAASIDLVNGSIDTQIEKVLALSEAEATAFLNKEHTAIKNATNAMEKKTDYYLGDFSIGDTDLAAFIKEYSERGVRLQENLDGTISVRLEANVTEAEATIQDMMTGLRNAFGEDLSGSPDASSFFGWLENNLNTVSSTIEKYQEIYEKAQLARMVSDTEKYEANGREQSAAKWLNDYATAIQNYNNALASGNEEDISTAEASFKAIDSIMKNLAVGSMSDYADEISEVRDSLDEAAASNNEFVNSITKPSTSSGSKTIKEYADDIKELRMSEQDFVEDYFLGYKSAEKIVDNAFDSGIIADKSRESIEAVAHILAENGILIVDQAREIGENVSQALFGMGDATDTEGDFQKSLNNYKTEILSLQSDLKKALAGELTADDIIDLRFKHSELTGYSDDNIANGIKSLIYSQVKGAQSVINEAMSQSQNRSTQEYLQGFWDYFNTIGNTDVEEIPLKGTIEDFYDVLKNEDFNKSVENVTSNIDKVKSAMDKLKDGDYTKADFYEDFVSQFPGMEQYVDDMGTGLNELFNQLMYGGSIVGETGSLTGVFNSKLEELSEVSPEAASALRDWLNAIQESYLEVEEASSAIDNLKESLGGFATYQSNVSKALGASTSAVGLTTEEIMNLVDAYKDIESFDAAKLFQSTGDGVRLNTEELERLNAIIERNTLTDLYHNLADARQKLAEAQANGDDTTGLENDIATAQALIAQYEGMTSAYNKWIQAKSGGGERDSYAAIGSAYGEMEKIYNAGWYDDPALQSYLNLLLGDNRTGNAVEDWGKLSQTIGDTGKSLMDFWQYGENGELVTDGLFDMLDVIHDYDKSIVKAGKDGKYSFDLTADNIERVADYLGTSPEMVRRFARALDDVGDVTIVGSVIDDLETAQNAVDRIGEIIGEATSKNPEIDIKTVVENSDEIQSLAEEIASLPPEVQTEIGVTTVGDVDGILKQLSENPESIGVTITYEGEKSELEPATQTTTINYEGEKSEFDDATQTANINYEGYKSTFASATQTVYLNYSGIKTSLSPLHQTVFVDRVDRAPKASGTLSRARANGSAYNVANLRRAYADGNVALSQDEMALVNELGTESIIRNGNWYLLPRGMHQEMLKKGDIVLSAAQTKALINTGAAPGHGRAYAYGTIGHAYAESYFGTGLQRRQNNNKSNNSSNNSSRNNNYRNTSNSNNSNKSNKSSGDKPKSSETKDDFKEIFDWIEVRIDRIERQIKNLGIVAQSTFQKLTTRLKASNSEIQQVRGEIITQTRGLTRYMQEANKVGLSKAWRQRVQAGEIDIDTIKDEKLAEKIKDYQQWYEKALDCRDAIKELKEQLGELYQEQFDTIATDYENKLSQIEHRTNTFNNAIDALEARGYLRSAKYYEQLRSVEKTNLTTLTNERNALTASLNKALASGYIKKGSESYYEMVNQINEVNEAIQESKTSIIEFGNAIREVKWEHFDYLQEQISNITKEAEFLIDLMDDSDLFKDNGQLTKTGMATMGLHAQNYDVYMAQAKKYAKEIKKINAEIAKDKNNTKLLERRQELLEAQRDSILAAEDEKQAIRDMVQEGINTELDALKKLIDKYNDAIDSAKDLNDYQKKVRDQAGEVAKLEKQLSAYSGDKSEENRSRLQKIRNDLADARETLKESEQDRYVSEQKKLFSNLYDEYETTLNKRLDNIDKLMVDMQAKVDSNAKSISKTLQQEAASVGYTITSSEKSIWGSAGSGFSLLSNVNSTISSIAASVNAMVAKSNTIANNTTVPTVNTAKAEAVGAKNAVRNELLSVIAMGTKRSKKLSATDKNTNHALWEYIVSKYGYAPTNAIYKKLGSLVGVKVSNKPTATERNNLLKALKAKGLATGTKNVVSGGMYWTNEDGAETLVRKSDHAILTRIGQGDRMYNAMASENLWNAANNPGDFIVENLSKISKIPSGFAGTNIGSVNYEVNIPIEHVGDYNDFMNQLKKDGQFEKFIQSMTVDRLAGRSKLAKNKFQW